MRDHPASQPQPTPSIPIQHSPLVFAVYGDMRRCQGGQWKLVPAWIPDEDPERKIHKEKYLILAMFLFHLAAIQVTLPLSCDDQCNHAPAWAFGISGVWFCWEILQENRPKPPCSLGKPRVSGFDVLFKGSQWKSHCCPIRQRILSHRTNQKNWWCMANLI